MTLKQIYDTDKKVKIVIKADRGFMGNGKRAYRVLHIDDDLIERKIISRFLQMSEYYLFEVSSAVSLNEGMTILYRNQFDVVLLDMGLPDSYGIDTFLNIKSHFPHIPVIILTGQNEEDLGLSVIQSGAQDYLSKEQVTADFLVKTIIFAIERHKQLLAKEKQ